MANHVSALKRVRQTEKRTAANRANKSRVRKSLRALREALTKGDSAAVAEQYRKTVSTRQERAEGHPARQHGLALQEPPPRARKSAERENRIICFGGSPCIYAGVGVLQRSGNRSTLVMRFSAGIGKIQG